MDDAIEPPREQIPGAGDSEFGGAPEISRRVGSILVAVEREAQRLREEAREEANRYLEDARRRADGLVAERQRLIATVSDELVAKSRAVVGRLDDAAPVQRGFENLVRALGEAAERLAREAESGGAGFAPRPFHEVTGQPPVPPAYPPAAPETGPAPFAAQPHPARAPSKPGWQAPVTPNPRLD